MVREGLGMGLPQIGLLLLLLLLLGARGTTDLAPGAHHQLEKREGGPCVCVYVKEPGLSQ